METLEARRRQLERFGESLLIDGAKYPCSANREFVSSSGMTGEAVVIRITREDARILSVGAPVTLLDVWQETRRYTVRVIRPEDSGLTALVVEERD